MSETIAIEWLKSPNKTVQHIRTIFPNGRSFVGNARDQAVSVFKYLAENHRLDFSELNERIKTAFGWGIIFSRKKQGLHKPYNVGVRWVVLRERKKYAPENNTSVHCL
ncbi:hypothetical protein [Candidatus Spongiihabitans sp.]|uniref:hypothetical protein n=1 Tax=Candidatus Spongiihabitans sp. TaxID=3101308 RepID=UPI003C6EADC7